MISGAVGAFVGVGVDVGAKVVVIVGEGVIVNVAEGVGVNVAGAEVEVSVVKGM
jgi:hypothetical protein